MIELEWTKLKRMDLKKIKTSTLEQSITKAGESILHLCFSDFSFSFHIWFSLCVILFHCQHLVFTISFLPTFTHFFTPIDFGEYYRKSFKCFSIISKSIVLQKILSIFKILNYFHHLFFTLKLLPSLANLAILFQVPLKTLDNIFFLSNFIVFSTMMLCLIYTIVTTFTKQHLLVGCCLIL